jgi:hypothetical protein
MARKPKAVRPEEKTQVEQFIETARQIGVDETGEAFERAFDKIARTKPPDREGSPKGRAPTKSKPRR